MPLEATVRLTAIRSIAAGRAGIGTERDGRPSVQLERPAMERSFWELAAPPPPETRIREGGSA